VATTTTASAGLFGVGLTASGAAAAFETTQGVGQLFSVRKISILTPGYYQVNVDDVGFPALFQNLAAIVTRGTARVGSIYGGGTFGFPAVVGNYSVNFVAQPTGTDQAGTYSMVVMTAPAPTLDFASASPSVASGATVTLNWTGANVSSCTASNGWTGSKDLKGTFTSAALTATTTFALSCDGPGGNVAKSVTVSVNAAPELGKKGGGGALRPEVLVVLLGLILMRRRMFPC
jgi:plastocyanin